MYYEAHLELQILSRIINAEFDHKLLYVVILHFKMCKKINSCHISMY